MRSSKKVYISCAIIILIIIAALGTYSYFEAHDYKDYIHSLYFNTKPSEMCRPPLHKSGNLDFVYPCHHWTTESMCNHKSTHTVNKWEDYYQNCHWEPASGNNQDATTLSGSCEASNAACGFTI